MGLIKGIISSVERASKVKHVTNMIVGTTEIVGSAVTEITKYKNTPKIKAPKCAKEYIGKNYLEVKNELSAYGFNDFRLIPKKDMLLGKLKRPGTVKSIAINGDDEFAKKSVHLANSVVTIVYHEQ